MGIVCPPTLPVWDVLVHFQSPFVISLQASWYQIIRTSRNDSTLIPKLRILVSQPIICLQYPMVLLQCGGSEGRFVALSIFM